MVLSLARQLRCSVLITKVYRQRELRKGLRTPLHLTLWSLLSLAHGCLKGIH